MAAASEAVKALYGMDATEKMLQLKLANTWYRTAMLSASSML